MEKSSNDKSQKKGISTGAKVAIGGGRPFLVIVGLVFLSMFIITFLAPIYLANNFLKDGKEIGFVYTHPDYAELFNKPKLNYFKSFP